MVFFFFFSFFFETKASGVLYDYEEQKASAEREGWMDRNRMSTGWALYRGVPGGSVPLARALDDAVWHLDVTS